jgi:hypothetical protein
LSARYAITPPNIVDIAVFTPQSYTPPILTSKTKLGEPVFWFSSVEVAGFCNRHYTWLHGQVYQFTCLGYRALACIF